MPVKRCLNCPALAKNSRCATCAAEHERTRRPSATGRYGPGWNAISKAQTTRQRYCSVCGHTGSKDNPLTAEHLTPISHRGGNDQKNLTTLCRQHNSARGNRLN